MRGSRRTAKSDCSNKAALVKVKVKVAATTTIRTCLRTEYLREGPMSLSPADCWLLGARRSMLVREKVPQWFWIGSIRVSAGALSIKCHGHGTLVGSTAVEEPALALVPNGIDDGRSVPSNKAWASAEPFTVTVAARL